MSAKVSGYRTPFQPVVWTVDFLAQLALRRDRIHLELASHDEENFLHLGSPFE
jgi:hypothetical protein